MSRTTLAVVLGAVGLLAVLMLVFSPQFSSVGFGLTGLLLASFTLALYGVGIALLIALLVLVLKLITLVDRINRQAER